MPYECAPISIFFDDRIEGLASFPPDRSESIELLDEVLAQA